MKRFLCVFWITGFLSNIIPLFAQQQRISHFNIVSINASSITYNVAFDASQDDNVGVVISTNSQPSFDNAITKHVVSDQNRKPGVLYKGTFSKLKPDAQYFIRPIIQSSRTGILILGEVYCVKTSCRQANGHKYVDLGLSVMWADCNVGACSPEDYGEYYAWGMTLPSTHYVFGDNSPKPYYDQSTYVYYTAGHYTKYCQIDRIIDLEESNDVARVQWGGTWRMPTQDELLELYRRCVFSHCSKNGVFGFLITGPNGNSIFLPAAGEYVGSKIEFKSSSASIWSSRINYNYDTKQIEDDSYAVIFYCNPSFDEPQKGVHDCKRYIGLSVRPVIE